MLRLLEILIAHHATTPEKQAERELKDLRIDLFQAEQDLIDAQIRSGYYRARLAFIEEVRKKESMWSPTSEGAAVKNSERNHSDGDVENLKEVDAPQDSNPCLRFCTVYRNADMSRPSRQVLPPLRRRSHP
jgi:hypothetical protein